LATGKFESITLFIGRVILFRMILSRKPALSGIALRAP
jgi:hypothetical protein